MIKKHLRCVNKSLSPLASKVHQPDSPVRARSWNECRAGRGDLVEVSE